MTDSKNASCSAWLSSISEHTIERLDEYYKLNPEKMPDVVFAEEGEEDIARLFSDEFQYGIVTFENGFISKRVDI